MIINNVNKSHTVQSTLNQHHGKVSQNFSNNKMQNSHFMTNGEIILTNDPKIKTKTAQINDGLSPFLLNLCQ